MDAAALTRLTKALWAHAEEGLTDLAGGQLQKGRRWLLRRLRPCPACRHLEQSRWRAADLLARTLHDPLVAAAYQAGDGVCFRHLRLLLSICREGAAAELVVRTMEVRLRVLEWELAEFLRRQDWNARFEPSDAEATSPFRAVSFYSGLQLRPRPRTPGFPPPPATGAGVGVPGAGGT